MLELLDNFASPCKACTTVELGPAYIPANHQYYVNVHALNGWIFQNHFDCLASAMVGGINTVYKVKRGNSLFTTKDIVQVLKMKHAENISDYLTGYCMKKYPKVNWQEVFTTLVIIVQFLFATGNNPTFFCFFAILVERGIKWGIHKKYP